MKKRVLLVGLVVGLLVMLVGVLASLVRSLRPTDAALSSHDKLVDLSALQPGETLSIAWENWDVIVLHREKGQVDWLKNYIPPSLEPGRDDDMPAQISYPHLRSETPDYLVVAIWRAGKQLMLHETRRSVSGCDDLRYTRESIRTAAGIMFPGGLYCASMYGHEIRDLSRSPFVYDPAGRSASPYYQPLSVPPHRITGKILLLTRL